MEIKMWIEPGRYTLPNGDELYDVGKWVLGLEHNCAACGEYQVDSKVLVYPHEHLLAFLEDREFEGKKPHDAHVYLVCDECKSKIPEVGDDTKEIIRFISRLDVAKLPSFHVDPSAELVFHTRVKPAALKEALEGLPVKINKTCFEIVEPGHLYFMNENREFLISIFPEQKKVMLIKHKPDRSDVLYFGWPEWDDVNGMVAYLRSASGQELAWVQELMWFRINEKVRESSTERLKKEISPLLDKVFDRILEEEECQCPSCREED